MSNFKHTIIAVSAVAIIGSLFISQLGEFVNRPVDAELLSHATRASIEVNEEESVGGSDSVDEAEAESDVEETEEGSADITQTMSEEELEALIEKKSEPQTNYVKITSGTLTVHDNPSEESSTVDKLDCKSEVTVLSASEGWTTIEYDGGKVGYVESENVTESKDEAEFASKYYDNYVKGTVTTQNGGSVRIRKGPSTSTDVVSTLENGTDVLLLWNDGDFVKVFYGDDYQSGYIVASALTLKDEWVSKEKVEQVQAEAQKKKEEEAAKKKAEEDAKKKAEEDAKKKAQAAANAKTSSKTATKSSSSAQTSTATAPASSKGQAIVNEAKKYLGVKYVYGGSSPSGFDCSGLVKYVCAKNGISLSRTSSAQSKQGVTVSKSNLQPGDLIFFAKNGNVHHVGIYIGNGQMIHAPHTGSYVKIDSINTAYRQKEFYCAKRVY